MRVEVQVVRIQRGRAVVEAQSLEGAEVAVLDLALRDRMPYAWSGETFEAEWSIPVSRSSSPPAPVNDEVGAAAPVDPPTPSGGGTVSK